MRPLANLLVEVWRGTLHHRSGNSSMGWKGYICGFRRNNMDHVIMACCDHVAINNKLAHIPILVQILIQKGTKGMWIVD